MKRASSGSGGFFHVRATPDATSSEDGKAGPIREDKLQLPGEDWYIFFQSFLDLALLGCKELTEDDKRMGSEKKLLIVAIIFNLKHGIEVLIKAINRTVDEYGLVTDVTDTKKNDRHHDIKKLFKDLKDKKKLKKSSEVVKDLNKLEALIEKYSNLIFLKERYSSAVTIIDKENQLFKYPENDVVVSIDYRKFLENINRTDVKQFKDDAIELKKLTKKIKEKLTAR